MPRVDFRSQNYLRDPAAGLTKLRAGGPVVQVRFPIVGKTWITTTNDLAGRVLKDSKTFTMRKNGRVAGLRWWMPSRLRTLAVSMLTMDEPDHTRLRSIVDEAFRRRAILDMEPRITGGEGLIAELVRVEKECGRISSQEMVAMIFLLLGAGSETTTHLISGSVYELTKSPSLRDWLEEDWSRANLAIEEFLRFVSPVQFTK